ncbi:cation transport ATPase (P-type) domain-containing protein [Ditylenchus destructor]|uniref:Cation transport ATPase (P-type) domain-containing protein n=1 Tax=Ditylenchus destructor TaxID=166010 RepID=A0AAD4R5S1_9BILA|nr:cation transport ATPase (P-type) domain-containing protein [Ditylenchus destructor]
MNPSQESRERYMGNGRWVLFWIKLVLLISVTENHCWENPIYTFVDTNFIPGSISGQAGDVPIIQISGEDQIRRRSSQNPSQIATQFGIVRDQPPSTQLFSPINNTEGQQLIVVQEAFVELPIHHAGGTIGNYPGSVIAEVHQKFPLFVHSVVKAQSFAEKKLSFAVPPAKSKWRFRGMVSQIRKCLPFARRVGDSNPDQNLPTYGQKPSTANRRASGEEVTEKQRVVRANDREFNSAFDYADNYIQTSKYNLITFMPKNLWEQFQRLANFYFLVLMLLQLIPEISSVAWYSTFLPLSIVIAITAVKDGWDDYQRHQSDNQVNNRTSYIVRNGQLVDEKWMNVKVGDIIRMENEHFIAADLLLLSSSEPHGLCYIETAELDGETNLKTRAALPETVSMGDIVQDIFSFDGEIYCEPPNNRLDRFEGRMVLKGRQIPLDNNRLLLRGCRLRNTRWCYGLVVFAGKDTKLMMNSGKTVLKRTSLDRFLNVLILGIVLFLFAMCLICAFLSMVWESVTGQYFQVYLPWDKVVEESIQGTTIKLIFIAFLQLFAYIILLNTVVPISLYISVEMIRFIQSLWINWDRKMYYEKTDTPAKARTTTLNEELGQVQYIFSDKTGTLTQNIMIFKKCSINGRSYGDLMSDRGEILEIDEHTKFLDFSTMSRWSEPNFRFYDKSLLEDTKRGLAEVHEFWRLLAICHTVMPERKTGNQLEYQAQSPDEAALTSAARNFGFVFKSRTPHSITIEVGGKEEVYEVIHILDFDNVRKRMSVIVRGGPRSDPNAKKNIKLYCKGADTMILERLSREHTSELLKAATLQHLDKFASDGLRTLCVAYKQIDHDYCLSWIEREREASLDVTNKDQRLNDLYEEIEKDMVLLGATAIEDKLQDGVPQCIATLAAANIKLWVLTGDKTETAINIGYSCHLLTEDMKEVFVIDGKEEREVECQLKDIRRRIDRAPTATPTTDYPPSYFATFPTKQRSLFHCGSSAILDFLPFSILLAIFVSFWSIIRWLASRTLHIFRRILGLCRKKHSGSLEDIPPTPKEKKSFFYNHLPNSFADFVKPQAQTVPDPVSQYIAEQIHALEVAEEECTEYKSMAAPDEPASPEAIPRRGSILVTPADIRRGSIVLNAPIRSVIRDRDVERNPVAAGSAKELIGRRRDTVTGGSQFYMPPQTPQSRTTSPPGRTPSNLSKAHTPTIENGYSPSAQKLSVPQTHHGYPSARFSDDPSEKAQLNGNHFHAAESADPDGLPPQEGFALVINGDSLVHALKKKYEKLFLEIGCMCIASFFCSIIGQFRYLERLLLVHGRWSYLRMAKFLRYFFYKNFSYTLTHFWYSFFCGYSAQTIYDPLLIACYNMFFTSLPVLAMGIFDQDVNDEYSLQYPKLYIPGQYNLFFNMRIFIYSIIHGMISSIVLFFIPYGTFYHASSVNGRDMNDYPMLCFTVFTALVIVVTGQIMFDTTYWTVFNLFVIFGSIFFYFLLAWVFYRVVPIDVAAWFPSVIQSYDVANRAFMSPLFWLSILLICVILLVPTLANRFFWFDTRPSYAERLRVRHKLWPADGRRPPTAAAKPLPSRTAATRRSRRGSLRSGYAFSHSQGFGELIAKGTLFKNIEHLRVSSFQRPHSPRRASKTAAAGLSPINEQNSSSSIPSGASSQVYTPPHLAGKKSRSKTKSPEPKPDYNVSKRRSTSSSGTDSGRRASGREEVSSLPKGPSPTESSGSLLTTARVKAVPVLRNTPSPSFESTRHNLVVNMDEDRLPSNWQLNSDGTLDIPELENPPMSGQSTSTTTATSRRPQTNSSSPVSTTFVSKKKKPTNAKPRRLDSIASANEPEAGVLVQGPSTSQAPLQSTSRSTKSSKPVSQVDTKRIRDTSLTGHEPQTSGHGQNGGVSSRNRPDASHKSTGRRKTETEKSSPKVRPKRRARKKKSTNVTSESDEPEAKDVRF